MKKKDLVNILLKDGWVKSAEDQRVLTKGFFRIFIISYTVADHELGVITGVLVVKSILITFRSPDGSLSEFDESVNIKSRDDIVNEIRCFVDKKRLNIKKELLLDIDALLKLYYEV